jgi:hypothetical protein
MTCEGQHAGRIALHNICTDETETGTEPLSRLRLNDIGLKLCAMNPQRIIQLAKRLRQH